MTQPHAPLQTSRVQIADLAPLITLSILILVFAVLGNHFLSLSTISMILTQGAVLAIVATGLTFVLLCAEIDLSVGMLALLSAAICGVLWESSFAAGPKAVNGADHVSWSVTAMVILVPALVAVLMGLATGWLTISSGLPSFIISLAMMNIADGLARFLLRDGTVYLPPVLETTGNRSLFELDCGTYGALRIPYSAILAAFVMITAHLVLQYTRFGRYVYMTGGNRQAARLAGVRTDRIVIACLAICAVTTACGGMVSSGRMQSVTVDQNRDLLLDAVACVVLGGTSLFGGEGSIGRTLVGVLSFMVLKVGLNLTNIKQLIKNMPLSADVKESWLKISWVAGFEHLRPFVLGLVLMVALVIHGRLVKHRTN